TLTGLLLGFTFSMAVNRYEHRRDLEIQEADAISTLWQRSATLAEPTRSHADSITSLFLTAMDDSFSHSEERTAAFENRIPLAAWIILMFVATAAVVLVSVDIGSRFS